MIALLALLLATVFAPMHGLVLAPAGAHDAVVRNDDVTNMIAQQTRRYRLSPAIGVHSGVGIDGIIDRSTSPWTLREATVAAPFSPGMPDQGRAVPVDVGKKLPPATLVDQNGRLVGLNRAFTGKVVLLSFIFTRCPDATLCPAISGKYAYLQSHLDPARFALVEITLDPPYDSPAVLRDYGKQYGADTRIWHLLTGTGSTIQRLLNAFGINSLRVSSANFIHNDKLYIVQPNGTVAYLVDTAGWDPGGVIAEASAVAGMASNPLERFKLSLIADVVALCGGSQFAGIVLLEIGLFFLILAVVAVSLWVVGRVLWGSGSRQT
ncbi:MAG: SCO family protein [Candidatus Eremiobacteraeota bacterium]|nr:SCO family protein [Candidatus Eremiobacteraeota bacterium]